VRKTYWIVCPKATSTLPKITIFREWLLAEAADDMRRLRALWVVRTKAFA
jgi:LysR family glycine cleavage system transcriptional activator